MHCSREANCRSDVAPANRPYIHLWAKWHKEDEHLTYTHAEGEQQPTPLYSSDVRET